METIGGIMIPPQYKIGFLMEIMYLEPIADAFLLIHLPKVNPFFFDLS